MKLQFSFSLETDKGLGVTIVAAIVKCWSLCVGKIWPKRHETKEQERCGREKPAIAARPSITKLANVNDPVEDGDR